MGSQVQKRPKKPLQRPKATQCSPKSAVFRQNPDFLPISTLFHRKAQIHQKPLHEKVTPPHDFLVFLNGKLPMVAFGVLVKSD